MNSNEGGNAPLVFVHGLRLWGFDMAALAARLRSDGRTIRYFRYAAHLRGLDQNADGLAKFLGRFPGCDILAHSLGGVVVHAALQRLGSSANVRRFAALGVPFRGTRAGVWMRSHGFGFAVGRTVSDWLGRGGLHEWPHAAELGLFTGAREFGIGAMLGILPTPNDGLIALDESRIAGARVHAVIATNHMGLLFSKATAKLAGRFFEKGSLER